MSCHNEDVGNLKICELMVVPVSENSTVHVKAKQYVIRMLGNWTSTSIL